MINLFSSILHLPLGKQIYPLPRKGAATTKNKMQLKSLFAFAALAVVPAVSVPFQGSNTFNNCEVSVRDKSGTEVAHSCITAGFSKNVGGAIVLASKTCVITTTSKTLTAVKIGSCDF